MPREELFKTEEELEEWHRNLWKKAGDQFSNRNARQQILQRAEEMHEQGLPVEEIGREVIGYLPEAVQPGADYVTWKTGDYQPDSIFTLTLDPNEGPLRVVNMHDGKLRLENNREFGYIRIIDQRNDPQSGLQSAILFPVD